MKSRLSLRTWRRRMPRGDLRAQRTRVRGRLGARRLFPRPGVCLSTDCWSSGATHSDALNKLRAPAVCSRLPCRSVAGGSEPRCWSPRVGKRVRRVSAPPPPQSTPPRGALRSPCPLVIPDPSTPSRFCRQGSGVSRLLQSPSNPRTPSERTPRCLGQQRAHRPPASASSEFPYQGLPWGGGPRLQASVRSLRAIANPGCLSGRGPRRVAGTEPKSQKRGPP